MILLSCTEDETPIPAPTAADATFTVSVDTENPNMLHFSASTSVNAWYTHWSFGDGTSSEGFEATKTYYTKGDYEVRFKVFTEGGNSSTTQTISILNDAIDDSNLVINGSFDDDSGWTIVNHFEATNLEGQVTIADGVAKFTESSNTWKHMGIYTEVDLVPGTYQFDMDVSFTEINEIWGEVYIGQDIPVAGSDYTGDQQVLKAYNAWDCSPKSYVGKASAYGCDTNSKPGNFTITQAGTYYLLFRTGGAKYGSEGIVIDNLELREE